MDIKCRFIVYKKTKSNLRKPKDLRYPVYMLTSKEKFNRNQAVTCWKENLCARCEKRLKCLTLKQESISVQADNWVENSWLYKKDTIFMKTKWYVRCCRAKLRRK